jgi:hypothetical protein
MFRSNRPMILTLLGFWMTLCPHQATAQALNPPAKGISRWDPTNQVLFFGDGFETPGTRIRGYVDARQRGADIDLFKDFPGLQGAGVDGLAAGPDGTTIIAVTLNFGGHNIRSAILTYDSSGRLVQTWDPAPQYADAIAFSQVDDALFVLGDRDIREGSDASDYPLLVEYSRDGQVRKSMVPVSTLLDGTNSFHQGGEIGEITLKITKDRIYIYAPTDREALIFDRDGASLAHRSVSYIIERFAADAGFHLAQIHALDFTDDGNLVVELLLGSDTDYSVDVVRIDIKTGQIVTVRKALHGDGLSFVGVKGSQYLYLSSYNQSLYVQSADGQEPEPFSAATTH